MKAVAPRKRVGHHIVHARAVADGELVALKFGEPPVVLPVGAARGTTAHKELEGLVVAVQVEVVAMEVVAKRLASPDDSEAFRLRGTVAALDIGKDAAGVANSARVAVVVVLGEDGAQGGTTGIGMQGEKFRKVRLSQDWLGNKCLLEPVERGVVCCRPELLDVRRTSLVVGELGEGIQRRRYVREVFDVEPEKIDHAEEGHDLFQVLRARVVGDGGAELGVRASGVARDDEAAVHDLMLAEEALLGIEFEAGLLQALHDKRDVALVLLPSLAIDNDVVEVDLAEPLKIRIAGGCADVICKDTLDEALKYGGGILEAHSQPVKLLEAIVASIKGSFRAISGVDQVAVEGALQIQGREPFAATDRFGKVFDPGKGMAVRDGRVVQAAKVDAKAVIVDGLVCILLRNHQRVTGPRADAIATDVTVSVFADASVKSFFLQMGKATRGLIVGSGIACVNTSVAVLLGVDVANIKLV